MASAARLAVPLQPVRLCRTNQQPSLAADHLVGTLEELIQRGFIEAFEDERGVIRFRPCLVAKRRVA